MATRKAPTNEQHHKLYVSNDNGRDGDFLVHRLCAIAIGYPPYPDDDTAQRLQSRRLRALLVERPELANFKDASSDNSAAGCYPLHTAAQYANLHAVKELIAAGAQLNTRKNNGVTPLCVCVHNYGVGAHRSSGSRKHSLIGDQIDDEEYMAASRACFEALLDAGADINAGHSEEGGDGFDAVMTCTAHVYSRPDVCLPLLKVLLARGARLDSLFNFKQNEPGNAFSGGGDVTACHWAVKEGHHRCLEVLLLAGADITIKASLGPMTPSGPMDVLGMAEAEASGSHNDDDEPDARAFLTIARVAAMMQSSPMEALALVHKPSARAILRCAPEQRKRQRLTTRLNGSPPAEAHNRHARRALRSALDMYTAGQKAAARVGYADALLYRGALSSRESFYAMHNAVGCEMEMAACATDWVYARELAVDLCATFPERALAHVQLGRLLSDMEEAFARDEGFANRKARTGRKVTAKAMARCVELARNAPDFAEAREEVELVERKASSQVMSKRQAAAYEMYCRAMRMNEDDDAQTPRKRAIAADLCSQAFADSGGGMKGVLQLRAANAQEVATALVRPLRGSDDLLHLGDSKVHADCELTVLELLQALSRTMPHVACSWIASAATISRTWRAAAVLTLQTQAIEQLRMVCDADGPSGSERIAVRMNLVSALAAMGQFEASRSLGRRVWNDRLLSEGNGDFTLISFGKAQHSDIEWTQWAKFVRNAISHGGRIVGLTETGREEPNELVRALQQTACLEMAGCILKHADSVRRRGVGPMVLSNWLLTAQSVCADVEVPAALLRAIRGWAGARGSSLSSAELDSLWGSMLSEARTRRHTETAEEVAASFLPLSLTDGPRAPQAARAAGDRSRKGKKKGSKGKKKKGGRGHEGGEAEEEEEELEVLEESAESVAAALAVAAPAAAEEDECPVCSVEESEKGAPRFLTLPCEGRHRVCTLCARNWRVTCLATLVEFSCPLCRESLEGWEP
jgi:ankyrin repeat protein